MSDQPTDPHRSPDEQSATPPPPAQQPFGGYLPPGYPQQPGPYQGAYPEQSSGYPPQPGPAAGYPRQPGYPPPGHTFPPVSAQPSPLGGLTDLRFTRRITPALAKIVYLAVVVLAGTFTVVGILAAVGSFDQAGSMYYGGGGFVVTGLLSLVIAPLASFILVAFARFWLEYFLDRASAARSS